MDEKCLNEAEVCDAFITPAIIRLGRLAINEQYHIFIKSLYITK